jgi:hypothetical protein
MLAGIASPGKQPRRPTAVSGVGDGRIATSSQTKAPAHLTVPYNRRLRRHDNMAWRKEAC